MRNAPRPGRQADPNRLISRLRWWWAWKVHPKLCTKCLTSPGDEQ